MQDVLGSQKIFYENKALLVQLVEQRSPKPPVVGSNPACPDFLRNIDMSKFVQFVRESKAELKRVDWPSKEDVLSSVKVVIVSTVVIAVLLGVLDLAFTQVFRMLMK